MNVQIFACDVRSFGDAMREIYAKGMLRSDFILMNFDTITNANLIPSIMKAHKDNCKRDKETAMTVVYKKISPGQRSGNEIVIATNSRTKRLLFHQRILSTVKEEKFKFPIDIILDNKEVSISHDLMDPHIAICSTTALYLFSDNFDYDSRDQFIRGLVMDQELQAASIYVEQLPTDQYAAKVSDWIAYHMVSQDIINRWAYPLVPDMGVCELKQQYLFLKNNIYRNNSVKVERNCCLKNDVVLHENCTIDDESLLARCVLGKNCKVGKNCTIRNAYIFQNSTIGDGCNLQNCVIGSNVKIGPGCSIADGSVIANDCIIDTNQLISGWLIQSSINGEDDFSSETFEKMNDHAYRLKEEREVSKTVDSEDDLDEVDEKYTYLKLVPLSPVYESSAYSSDTDSDEDENDVEAQQEDTHIFLTEVVDSLKRGYDEKTNPDFLILEINSSRYAYNMQLNEVNFFVIKAIFSLPAIQNSSDPLETFKNVYDYLGDKVLKNYIKGDGAMVDCLNAIIECCEESEKLRPKLLKTLHFLYNEDVLSEDIILSWFEDIDKEWVKKSLKKFIEWLQVEESEESD